MTNGEMRKTYTSTWTITAPWTMPPEHKTLSILKLKTADTFLTVPLIVHIELRTLEIYAPIPVTARSKAWVCGCPLVGTAGSNRAGGMYVCLFLVGFACCHRSLRQADPSSRGVLLNVVCMRVIKGNDNLYTNRE